MKEELPAFLLALFAFLLAFFVLLLSPLPALAAMEHRYAFNAPFSDDGLRHRLKAGARNGEEALISSRGYEALFDQPDIAAAVRLEMGGRPAGGQHADAVGPYGGFRKQIADLP
jgi:hypothetical protein